MRFLSITSGSSGNCIYIGSDNTHLIIDAGISGKRIEMGLNNLDICPSDLSGILVTHEHSDHIARRYNIPIYASSGTIDGIKCASGLGSIDESLFCRIEPNNDFTIGDLSIHAHPISHDANEPVSYRISDTKGRSAGVLTDLGCYSDDIVESFSGVNSLLIEANHDVNMLQVGRYPYYLKRRILGDCGHLSNESCGKLLCKLLHDDLNTILLGHLSAENNLPELAYEAVRLEILMGSDEYDPSDFDLKVASRSEWSNVVCV